MKPVSYWLDFLPEPYCSLAKKYHTQFGYDKQNLVSDNLKSALIKAFPAHKTPEGAKGWLKVFDSLKYKDCYGLKPAN